jgi:hypothetical protein
VKRAFDVAIFGWLDAVVCQYGGDCEFLFDLVDLHGLKLNLSYLDITKKSKNIRKSNPFFTKKIYTCLKYLYSLFLQ